MADIKSMLDNEIENEIENLSSLEEGEEKSGKIGAKNKRRLFKKRHNIASVKKETDTNVTSVF